MSKKFLNKADDVVAESLEGLVLTTGSIVRLDGQNVLLRRDFANVKEKQVTVISGGGSGHEPAFGGFVGAGMLTAAVAGGVFASPSASAVLAAIRAVAGPQGVLVVIMNYTGDRLNFGKAVERARTEGVNVRMVVVADDCALPRDKGITGRRGVAGTLLVQKVACAAAEAGLDLAAVEKEALAAAANVGTLGVALTCCTLPAQPPNDRLAADKIEIGLGIHGEPGIRQSPLLTADALVVEMVDAVIGPPGSDKGAYLPLDAGQAVALLINNLGATPPLELMIVARKAIKYLEERGASVARVIAGHLMTSLDMAGVSVSVMRVDPLSLARLDAATEVAPWCGASIAILPTSVPHIVAPATATPLGAGAAVSEGATTAAPCNFALAAAAVAAAAQAIQALEPDLTKWDVIAGDGDCGTTFARGAGRILEELHAGSLPLTDSAQLLRRLADAVAASMGGTSGAILDIFLTAGSQAARTSGYDAWRGAFVAGTEAIQFYGGAEVGMRTMMDAFGPAAEALKAGLGWEEAVAAAEAGADATLGMEAKAGRANYISAELVKTVPDPGAKAVATALRAALRAVSSS